MSDLSIFQIHRMYRSTGASFAKAQAEFTTGVMRNEQVSNFDFVQEPISLKTFRVE